jgi:hypothetical protein
LTARPIAVVVSVGKGGLMVRRVLVLAGSCLVLGSGSVHAWRYSANGSTQFSYDSAWSVTVDAGGDAIVGGSLEAGNERERLWATRFEGTTGKRRWMFLSEPTVLSSGGFVALDPGGDVFLAGRMHDAGIVIRLSGTRGNELWRTTLGDGIWAIASMPDGSIAVGGADQGDLLVARLAADTGAELWRVTDVSGATADVAVDPAGNVLAVGRLGWPDADGVVLKLAGGDGSELWRRTIGAAVQPDWCTTVALTSSGDVVAGGFLDFGNAGGLSWVERLDGGSGATVWSATAPPGDGGLGTLEVAVDAAGDVAVAGWGPGLGVLDGATGALRWDRLSAPASLPVPTGGAVAFDANGDVVYGHVSELVRLDGATGGPLWRMSLGGIAQGIAGPTVPSATVRGLAVAPDGLIVAVGSQGLPSSTGHFVDALVAGVRDRLAGTLLLITDDVANPQRRRLKLKSRDPAVVAGGYFPGSDAVGRPDVQGVDLVLENPTTAEAATLSLPAGGWKGTGSVSGAVRYRYKDGALALGPCKSAKLETGKGLQAVCAGAGIAFSLDEPVQGPLRVRFVVGDAGTPGASYAYCLEFVPVVDEPGRFRARAGSPPAACP